MSDEKVLIGMMRSPLPPDGVFLNKETGKMEQAGIIICPCGHMLQCRETVFSHWQQGHFDTPIYATKDEILEKMMKSRA